MKAIWKFPFAASIGTVASLTMPVGSRIVSVAFQHGMPTVWAEVDPSRAMERRQFMLIPTGCGYDDLYEHIGTIFDEPYVWHLLEVKP